MQKRYGFATTYTDVDADEFASREDNSASFFFATKEERDNAIEKFKNEVNFQWGFRAISSIIPIEL